MNPITSQKREEPERGSTTLENYVLPPADIIGNHAEYLLEIDMPGVRKEDLSIAIESDRLTIIGTRQIQGSGNPIYKERSDNSFLRVFELGNDIDRDKIRAEMSQGVLRLHLPKSDRVRLRKVPVA